MMRPMLPLLLLLTVSVSSRVTHAYLANCDKTDVDFIILEGDATSKAIENDIVGFVADLAKAGSSTHTTVKP